MTVRELDRLVNQTELDPTVKKVLRVVRSAVISGTASDPVIGQYTWSVGVSDQNGSRRFRFSMRRTNDSAHA